MKFFIDWGKGKAGPVETENTSALVLRVFQRNAGVDVLYLYRQLNSREPFAMYEREGREIVWYGPIKSRKAAPRWRYVKQSQRAGDWIRVGVLTLEHPEIEQRGPASGESADRILDLLDFPHR